MRNGMRYKFRCDTMAFVPEKKKPELQWSTNGGFEWVLHICISWLEGCIYHWWWHQSSSLWVIEMESQRFRFNPNFREKMSFHFLIFQTRWSSIMFTILIIHHLYHQSPSAKHSQTTKLYGYHTSAESGPASKEAKLMRCWSSVCRLEARWSSVDETSECLQAFRPEIPVMNNGVLWAYHC